VHLVKLKSRTDDFESISLELKFKNELAFYNILNFLNIFTEKWTKTSVGRNYLKEGNI